MFLKLQWANELLFTPALRQHGRIETLERIHQFADGISGLLQRGLLALRQLQRHNLLHALCSNAGRQTQIQIADAIATRIITGIDGARQHSFPIIEYGIDHLRQGGGGRIERAPGFEERYNLASALARACYDGFQPLRRDEFADGDAPYISTANKRNHVVSMSA